MMVQISLAMSSMEGQPKCYPSSQPPSNLDTRREDIERPSEEGLICVPQRLSG